MIIPGRGKGLTGTTGSSQRDEKGIRPSVTASRRYPAASVIHVRFAVHPSVPVAWGLSPGVGKVYRATQGEPGDSTRGRI